MAGLRFGGSGALLSCGAARGAPIMLTLLRFPLGASAAGSDGVATLLATGATLLGAGELTATCASGAWRLCMVGKGAVRQFAARRAERCAVQLPSAAVRVPLLAELSVGTCVVRLNCRLLSR